MTEAEKRQPGRKEGVVVLIALVLALAYCVDQYSSESESPDTASDNLAEDHLYSGWANVRVLDDAGLDALKTEAYREGRNPHYPDTGPMALVTVPVNRLNVDNMLVVLPLLCEALAEQAAWDGDRYSQVRVINRQNGHGFMLRDWQQSCDETILDGMIAGRWDAVLPWEMAEPAINGVGYGDLK